MTDVEGARRALEETLGPAEVLSDPLALRLYARDASMVEGGCALVAFPRSTEDIVACVTHRCRARPARRPSRSGTGLAGAATPIGDALVVVTPRCTGSSRCGRGSSRMGGAGSVQPGSVHRAPSARLHVRARPLIAADVIDRREREHERRRAALPRLRRDVRARAGAGRRHAGRTVERLGSEATRGGRLRPARRGRGLGGDARDRRRGVRPAHAAPAGRPHDAARLRDRRATARRPSRRSSRAASCPRPSR